MDKAKQLTGKEQVHIKRKSSQGKSKIRISYHMQHSISTTSRFLKDMEKYSKRCNSSRSKLNSAKEG